SCLPAQGRTTRGRSSRPTHPRVSAARVWLRCRLGQTRGPHVRRPEGLPHLSQRDRTTDHRAGILMRTESTNTFDRNAFRAGAIGVVLVVAFIVAGSRSLRDFDWALTTYAVGSVFAVFAVIYRYAVWAQRPATRMYLRRGLQAFFSRKR